MILEPLFIPDVLAQHVERLVAGLVGHLEDAGAVAGGAREKAAAKAMPGIARRVEVNLACSHCLATYRLDIVERRYLLTADVTVDPEIPFLMQ